MSGTTTEQVSVRTIARPRGIARRTLEEILGPVGVAINGNAPWDVRVHDDRFFERVLVEGTLGLGESYVDGWWDCDRLDEMVCRALRQNLDHRILDWRNKLFLVLMQLRNLQTLTRAKQVAERHYDLGNDFFAQMLGPTMNYSCAYWRDAEDLDAAQEAKMDLVARKLQLRPGDRLLDIGCGWGSMARFAAERYGCEAVGVTISRGQYEWAEERLRGTTARALFLDYRSPELQRLGPFDKIVSIGMFEHVGRRNYREFFSVVRSLLKNDGLFLLHSILNDHSAAEPWVNRYIFPNGMLPSHIDLDRALRNFFVVEDLHNFGADYDRTLMAWHANYSRYETQPDFPYSPQFQRMWRYYLLTFAGSFRARTRNQLCQIVLTKGGMSGGYRSVR
jgi:cyclopropane-fatty-acyl-phospholipid synthase